MPKLMRTARRTRITAGRGALLLMFTASQLAVAQVYSNQFQTAGSESNALTASGTLTTLSRTSLPTDGGGLASANQSMWLGTLGQNVPKSGTTPETVTLALSGLVSGSQYNVAFDLLIGSSWDGSAGFYGPDLWSLTAISGSSTSVLVNATFSNCGVFNELCGASSPQSYSDATPLGGASGPTFAPETGADAFFDASGNYGQDYGIYYFGHGIGNPMLSFTANGSTASLVFQREPVQSGDSGDEYWALDNIDVTGLSATATPEPSSLLLLGTGLAGALGWRRTRSRKTPRGIVTLP